MPRRIYRTLKYSWNYEKLSKWYCLKTAATETVERLKKICTSPSCTPMIQEELTALIALLEEHMPDEDLDDPCELVPENLVSPKFSEGNKYTDSPD